ncbi:MAG: flagellar brake protein [Lachnospiraceae bacterium]|nr:flagellar brake protein [Lachnospiraceae bacterium]
MYEMITPGDKIDIIRLKDSEGNSVEARQYASKIHDIADNGLAQISMPIEGSTIVPLEVGEEYQLCFYTERGMFRCKGEVVDRYKDNALHMASVHFTTELEKFQRRQYYRLECILNIKYHLISREEQMLVSRLENENFGDVAEREGALSELEAMRASKINATVTDISGGGCRFNSVYAHEADENVVVCLEFMLSKEKYYYELPAKVISSERIMNRPGYYATRVEFTGINIDQRETLIKYIFEEERKIRRRERGFA